MSGQPRVAILPQGSGPWAQTASAIGAAVEAAGGAVVDSPAKTEALIWAPAGLNTEEAGAGLKEALQHYPRLRWVQLASAGVEQYVPFLDHDHIWTSAKGLYSKPVAEHALALTLACLRHVKQYSRAQRWSGQAGRTLFDGRVTIFGGGGIAQQLIRLLDPFGCQVTVVRKHPDPIEGAAAVRVLGWDQRHRALPEADSVILALALTEETAHCFGRQQFEAMGPDACLVNVARSAHVVTDDLTAALASHQIGSAGLDVTDAEDLPPDHALWALDNCLITPHTASTIAMSVPLLIGRITANVRRFALSEPLVGVVDPDLGY